MCLYPMAAYKQKDGSMKFCGRWMDDIHGVLDPKREYVQIPCGQCFECRMARARMWACRMSAEASTCVENYFVTLTYDDEHLPIGYSVDSETGEAFQTATLCKEDVQKWMKRLRKAAEFSNRVEKPDVGIRFYLVGEYGDIGNRPHYHVCLFGIKLLDDLKEPSLTKSGFAQYVSPFLESTWKLGRLRVSRFGFESAGYVARYTLKKQTGDAAKVYSELGILSPFSLMSRRPGIGREYFEKHKDELYRYDKMSVSTQDGSLSLSLPTYYDNLYKKVDEVRLTDLKKKRVRLARSRHRFRSARTNLFVLDEIDFKAYEAKRKSELLFRPGDVHKNL